MKTLRFLSMLSLVLTMTTGHTQKVKTYKIWVTLVNQKEVKGTLYTASEDTLVILGEDLAQLTFVPGTIREIKVRRVGKGGKGAWIGAVSGLVAGALIGYASESGSGWEDVGAFAGGILGASVGALIGTGVGSSREKYVINGNRATYNAFLPRLQQYAPQKSIN
jgi:hypothetical protein